MLQLFLCHHHRTAEVGRGPRSSPCPTPCSSRVTPSSRGSGRRLQAVPAILHRPSFANPPLTPLEIVSHRTRLTASLCQPPRTPSTTASPTSTTPGNTRSLGTGVWAHPAWLQRPPTHTEPHLRRVLLQLGGVQPDITRFGLLGCVAFPPALHPRHRAVSRSAELSRVPRKGRDRGATSDAGSGPAPFFPPSPRAPPPPNGRQRLPRALVGERDQSERLGGMSGRSSPAHPGPCPI